MNNIYLYQDDFISLLNLINYLIKNKIKPNNIKPLSYCPTLLDEVINLKIEPTTNVIDFIIKIGNNKIFNIIYYVFLSDNENKELIIYYFCLNLLKYQTNIIYMRNLRCVTKALKIAKHVGNEAHRLKGFVRFQKLEHDIYYAEIAPDNNVLFLVSKHFKRRLKNEYWLIKDVKRKIISIYDKKDFYLIDEDNFQINDLKVAQEENDIKNMWKEFYDTIAIKERHNERCRMNFMPKKYWKYIIEMSDE